MTDTVDGDGVAEAAAQQAATKAIGDLTNAELREHVSRVTLAILGTICTAKGFVAMCGKSASADQAGGFLWQAEQELRNLLRQVEP